MNTYCLSLKSVSFSVSLSNSIYQKSITFLASILVCLSNLASISISLSNSVSLSNRPNSYSSFPKFYSIRASKIHCVFGFDFRGRGITSLPLFIYFLLFFLQIFNFLLFTKFIIKKKIEPKQRCFDSLNDTN